MIAVLDHVLQTDPNTSGSDQELYWCRASPRQQEERGKPDRERAYADPRGASAWEWAWPLDKVAGLWCSRPSWALAPCCIAPRLLRVSVQVCWVLLEASGSQGQCLRENHAGAGECCPVRKGDWQASGWASVKFPTGSSLGFPGKRDMTLDLVNFFCYLQFLIWVAGFFMCTCIKLTNSQIKRSLPLMNLEHTVKALGMMCSLTQWLFFF